MPTQTRVLYLCTGNSCRSQMAEGWARALGGDLLEVQSAGLEAHGKNPRAIEVMKEAGVDISDQASTVVTPEMVAWADLVITVCGHADEHCPAVASHAEKRHIPFDDPAKAEGTEQEVMAEFRRVRDQIKRSVEALLETL